jgi:hypothetical protein
MNILHDFYDNNSLDCLMLRAYTIDQAVGRSDRRQKNKVARTQHKKEITMHANGHTTVWGTHIGVGRRRDPKSWYEHLKEWWAAHKAARSEAKLAALAARWDARHEAVRPLHADAAIDMVASIHACSTTTALSSLSV